jgi:peptidoglycan hydrolase CwlO-like protein
MPKNRFFQKLILAFSRKSIIASAVVLFLIFGGVGDARVLAETGACDGNIEGKSDEELNAILKECEIEIAAQQKVLDGQKTKSASLQRDISILQARINGAKDKIKQKDITIKSIGKDITKKNQTISELQESIDKGKESLAQLIRRTNELDKTSFANALLTAESISDFYGDIDSFASIKKSVQISVEGIKSDKTETETVKQQLVTKQNDEMDAKAEIERQKSLVEKDQKDQSVLLSLSKNKEAEYSKVLKDRQAKASSIRAALFKLRGQGAIPFGDAYDYAKVASAKTGVRPAFILAILKQESNMGANVGTCNRPGDAKTWREIMPAAGQSWRDDQSAYLRITKELGISPDGQPLSCPLGAGWGGAMGPAQFIPTTWENIAPRIESTLGVAVANPWNPQHAIMANALYVMDLGAAAQTYTAEREAACKYYSGRGCSAPGVANAFYGNSVMNIAKDIQANIDVLEGF